MPGDLPDFSRAVESSQSLALLGTFTVTTTFRAVHTIGTITTTYGALLFEAKKTSGQVPAYAFVSPIVTGRNMLSFGAAFLPDINTPTKFTAIVPVANLGTGSITVGIMFTGSTKVGVTVYGLTVNPGVLLRSDGRAYPVGAFGHTVTTTAGRTTTVVPAPSTGRRILLQSVRLNATTAGSPKVVVTQNGSTTALVSIHGAAGGQTVEPIGGILCDPNTRVGLIAGATMSAFASATYDLAL